MVDRRRDEGKRHAARGDRRQCLRHAVLGGDCGGRTISRSETQPRRSSVSRLTAVRRGQNRPANFRMRRPVSFLNNTTQHTFFPGATEYWSFSRSSARRPFSRRRAPIPSGAEPASSHDARAAAARPRETARGRRSARPARAAHASRRRGEHNVVLDARGARGGAPPPRCDNPDRSNLRAMRAGTFRFLNLQVWTVRYQTMGLPESCRRLPTNVFVGNLGRGRRLAPLRGLHPDRSIQFAASGHQRAFALHLNAYHHCVVRSAVGTGCGTNCACGCGKNCAGGD